MPHVNTNPSWPEADLWVTHRFFPVGLFRAGRLCPMITISETDRAYTLVLLVEGLPKQAIRAQVENGVLTITVEIKPEAHGQPGFEAFGSDLFTRSFQLPDQLNTSELEGICANGTLQLILPKAEEGISPENRVIPIR